MAFEAEHLGQLGRLHQLTIDAYGAQHGGPAVPAIAVPFGLIGLHLAFDEGMTGNMVRAAHQYLANGPREWPVFGSPSAPAWLTIADVAGAAGPDDHAQRVERWARSVWDAWRPDHSRILAWADAALPREVRGRLRRG